MKKSSIITWHHVNLLGEYDFSDEKMNTITLFSLPVLYLCGIVPYLPPKNQKILHQKILTPLKIIDIEASKPHQNIQHKVGS
jgi:hypothetical protein